MFETGNTESIYILEPDVGVSAAEEKHQRRHGHHMCTFDSVSHQQI